MNYLNTNWPKGRPYAFYNKMALQFVVDNFDAIWETRFNRIVNGEGYAMQRFYYNKVSALGTCKRLLRDDDQLRRIMTKANVYQFVL
jgi:hypothetical protein